MPVTPTFSFTTGVATLPDVGTLSYNGCVFSPLFETHVSGTAVKDNANRTVKYVLYTITVDGYVTLPDGATSIAGAMATLYNLLSKQGGSLVYIGRAHNIVTNTAGGVAGIAASKSDVAWGPIPEVLEFQPLGGGLSAKIRWQIKVAVREGLLSGNNLLQFNYETTLTYGEDGYSSMSVRGTTEIPMTRTTILTRTLTTTVDEFRSELDKRIFTGIDLARFRVTRREFNVSRDKRTMEFDIAVEEKPHMDLPADCVLARGSYSVRPARSGMGLVSWLCTMRATYTVRADRPRRIAWFAFLAMLRVRMSWAGLAPDLKPKDASASPRGGIPGILTILAYPITVTAATLFSTIIKSATKAVDDTRKAWLIDFSIDEGLYLDSKTVSFSATWRVVTPISHIILASGLWRRIPRLDSSTGENLWATSMKAPIPGSPTGIMGSQSWIENKLDPKLDIIVDFGGG